MEKRIEYEIPGFIREQRLKEGLTIEYMCHVTKVSKSTYGNYESGEFIPRIDKVQRILRTLGYDLAIVKRGEEA